VYKAILSRILDLENTDEYWKSIPSYVKEKQNKAHGKILENYRA